MSDRAQRILVAGGGIGGLGAALNLAGQGMEVHVFEQSNAFAEVGAGIQLSPNCTRVLHQLGLESALREVAFLPEGTEMRAWKSGRMLSRNPLGQTVLEDYGLPYYHIHRADLMDVLSRAAEAESRITLHLDTRVTGFEAQQSSVTIRTEGAGFEGAGFEGDALVGADGIHSTIRAGLFGEDSPHFTGNVAWRALVPASRLPVGLVRPVAGVWWGPHKHFVHYYVRGGEMVNCVCVVEKKGWEVEGWNEHGDHQELRADFHGWHETVQALLDNMDPDNCFKWALFDRPPMQSWGRDRVTLLGDACHPTLPFMAQGAAMAIEDGAVLARCLHKGSDVAASLKRYQGLRLARTARIQAGSRRNAKVFHLSGVSAWMRNRAVGRVRANLMEWLYRYDALRAAD